LWLATNRILCGIFLIAAVLRLTRLTFQSFWLDEAHTAFYLSGQSLAVLGERMLKSGENGPLYYFLLAPWQQLFGGGEASLRSFSALVSLPAIPLAYFVFRKLARRPVALAGVACFALAPYQIWYAQEAKMYALLLTLTLASTATFLAACDQPTSRQEVLPKRLDQHSARQGRLLKSPDRFSAARQVAPGRRWRSTWRWLLYVLLAAASIYVHFFAALTIASHAVLALARLRRRPRRLAAAWIAIGAVLLPLGALQWLAIRRDVAGSAAGGAFAFGEQIGILLYAYSLNVTPLPVPLVLLAVITLLLVGTAVDAGWLGQDPPAGQPNTAVSLNAPDAPAAGAPGQLLALFWAPLAGYFLAAWALRTSLFADRYFIGLTPFFYLLLAIGLVQLWQIRRAAGAAAVGCVAAAWMYGTVYQLVTPVKQDFRSAVGRLSQEYLSGDAIIPVPSFNAFPAGYYVKGAPDFAYVDGPAVSSWAEGDSGPDVAALVGGRSRVWIITTEAPDYVPRARLEEWLGSHGRRDFDQEFPGGVRLERYTISAN
jgi:mannosyltransferase